MCRESTVKYETVIPMLVIRVKRRKINKEEYRNHLGFWNEVFTEPPKLKFVGCPARDVCEKL